MVEFEGDCFLPSRPSKLEHPIEIRGKKFAGYTVRTKEPSLGDPDATCLLKTKLHQLRVSVARKDPPSTLKDIMKEEPCDLCGLVSGLRRSSGGSLDFR